MSLNFLITSTEFLCHLHVLKSQIIQIIKFPTKQGRIFQQGLSRHYCIDSSLNQASLNICESVYAAICYYGNGQRFLNLFDDTPIASPNLIFVLFLSSSMNTQYTTTSILNTKISIRSFTSWLVPESFIYWGVCEFYRPQAP